MNITQKQVFRHFLNEHYKQLAKSDKRNLDSFFSEFFLEKELIKIIEFVHEEELVGDYYFDHMSKQDKLDMISDLDILNYFLSSWESESFLNPLFYPAVIHAVLEQLGHQMHYLMEKDILHWDNYDHSNYRSMLFKAGRVRKVYGVFGKSITETQAQLQRPRFNRFYDTRDDAEQALLELNDNTSMKVYAILIIK